MKYLYELCKISIKDWAFYRDTYKEIDKDLLYYIEAKTRSVSLANELFGTVKMIEHFYFDIKKDAKK